MSGKEVKEILKNEGITIAELTRLLGLNTEQALHSLLKADDVKSGLLERIAKVTNKSVLVFYPSSRDHTIATENGIAVSGSQNAVNTISERFINLLEKKDEQVDRMLDIIESLSKNLKP